MVNISTIKKVANQVDSLLNHNLKGIGSNKLTMSFSERIWKTLVPVTVAFFYLFVVFLCTILENGG